MSNVKNERFTVMNDVAIDILNTNLNCEDSRQMVDALEILKNAIQKDYDRWNAVVFPEKEDARTLDIKFNFGKKYVKVVVNNAAWGFVLLEDDTKFKRGDLLKSAGWSKPARNYARLNIIDHIGTVYYGVVKWAGIVI